jgi:hypothetical protein
VSAEGPNFCQTIGGMLSRFEQIGDSMVVDSPRGKHFCQKAWCLRFFTLSGATCDHHGRTLRGRSNPRLIYFIVAWAPNMANTLGPAVLRLAAASGRTEPSANRMLLPPPSSSTQLEPKNGVATGSGTPEQPTVGFAPNSNSRTIQEQVAAAIAVAKRRTVAALPAARDHEPVEGNRPTRKSAWSLL